MQDELPATLLGHELYGENLSDEEMLAWFAQEENGYYDLVDSQYFADQAYTYEYAALNELHAFRHLRREHFGTCLALGCARGDDVAELAPIVDRFVAIEPAKRWWADRIGGKPAEFRSPTLRGEVDMADGSIDLAVSLGVLHHIPNVSAVIAEFARLLRPGGVFVIREPITSMGDFRKPRPGLTPNERGIPHAMLQRWLEESGFVIERRSFCMVNALGAAMGKLGWKSGFNDRLFTRIDALASGLLSANAVYWRDSLPKKIAPSSIFFLARKR